MNQKLKLVYFSPTDSTKNILHKVAEEIDLPIDEEFNLTNYEYKDFKHSFEENDFILLGFPVHGGKIPKTAVNRFSGLRGNKSKIVVIQTYGNVHYGDSLLETHELVKNNGFTVVGLGSFVYQHNFIKSIGIDRPNKEDYDLIKYFGKKLTEKLNHDDESAIEMEITKPFKKHPPYPIRPKGRDSCVKCGLCVKLCPENAINEDNPRKTNKKRCVLCLRCVKYCPNNARDFTSVEKFMAKIFVEIIRRIFFKKENKSEIIV